MNGTGGGCRAEIPGVAADPGASADARWRGVTRHRQNMELIYIYTHIHMISHDYIDTI